MPRENRKYSPEFKIEVIETKLKENLSQMETARRFNLYIKRNGYQYPHGVRVAAWERIYLEEGKEGFYIERRGRSSKGRKKKLNTKVEEDLIAKCQRLEMENEYLKKLSALVSARERKEKK
jgi:transposase-like protein